MAVQTQIQARRGTAATWTSTNPTLAAGETGFETDTGKFKIGNGSTAWAALAYNTNGATVSPLTTKGDLYTYSTGNTRLPVGANGETIVADSSTATGLRYQGNFAAGKNKIINGDFGVWQRGTSFTLSSGPVNTYCADRFVFEAYGSSTAATVTRQTFTPGTAPVAGYEGQYFARLTNFATASAWQIRHRIENVQTFAGQTVTFSFWAKASTAVSGISYQTMQNFGSGGSGAVTVDIATGQSFTTSWARYSVTASIASISGKTIGTGSYLEFNFYQGSGATNSSTIDTWGWQVEAGSTATAFQTATGTIQGETSACQRYYYRISGATAPNIGLSTVGFNGGTTPGVRRAMIYLPVSMRTGPSVAIAGSGVRILNSGLTQLAAPPTINFNGSNNNLISLDLNLTSAGTAGQIGYWLIDSSSANDYVEASAEL